MLLFTSTYFVFLIAVFFLYWSMARWRPAALAVILFANYFFYAKWDLFYVALIPVASTIDYLVGLGLHAARRQWARRALLGVSLAVNVGILFTFKYMPLIDTAWKWIFPLGISFYTFQALSYTIDVYRRDAKPTTSYLAYLSAVSFFPTTLAGPITRPADLIKQLEKKGRELVASDGAKAFFLIGLGLSKKLLIADYLADNLVNRIFDLPKMYSGFEVLVGVYAYALQLYYDFSGYTDIAIGSGLLLGVKLPQNFNSPYRAQNIADFWRRWHISLSNWLRDYLYFSLPGLRSKWRVFTYTNLIVTMAIGGLWHGASWNFLVWGVIHGCGLSLTRAMQVLRGNTKPSSSWWARALRTFVTIQFVCFAWIFFRATTFETTLDILKRIGSLTFSTANLSAPIAMVLVVAAVLHYIPKKAYEWSINTYIAAPAVVQATAMALLILGIEYAAATGSAPFIYTKF